jgi:hypothetical protein
MTAWNGFTEDDLRRFEKVAKTLRRKAHGLMEEEDLYQSCALWALEHKGKYREAVEAGDNAAHKLLWSRMSDLIRQERARVGGYELEDQFNYTPKALKKILPNCFDNEWMVQAQDYDQVRTTGGSGHSDPANAWVMVADVRRGFQKLPEKDQALLKRTLVDAPDYSAVCKQLVAETGKELGVVQRGIDDSLRKLGRVLKGDH